MSMSQLLGATRRRLSDESGMTMAVVMGMMLVATLFSIAALSTAQNDIGPSQQDLDRKESYAAAEAGINDYFSKLNKDSNFWTYCNQAAKIGSSPITQPWTSSSTGTRPWRDVPGSSDADYTIELIPASPATSCNPSAATDTMIDKNSGMFTIRATGRSSAQGKGKYTYRSVTASFRRQSFLDFLYFTTYETLDPEYLRGTSNYTWALANCGKYEREGRPSGCTDITFANGDTVNGPFHTNDRLLVQGSPTFGRSKADLIEVSNPAPGWVANGSATPNFVGTYKAAQGELSMPPTNDELLQVATSGGKVYTGQTEIIFKTNGLMDVRNKAANGNSWNQMLNQPMPANGVIYVKAGSCNDNFNATNPYQVVDDGCPILNVSGQYASNLTLASQGDIIVRADQDPGTSADGKGLRRNGDVMMGLIANNFIRVYHPCSGGTNQSGYTHDVRIDAAILSLAHSFWVDNYACGARLGDLTVNGAIAQEFRGPVGTIGATGYTKNYWYDDRLKFRSPPYFLDPIESRWQIRKFNEQVPPNGS